MRKLDAVSVCVWSVVAAGLGFACSSSSGEPGDPPAGGDGNTMPGVPPDTENPGGMDPPGDGSPATGSGEGIPENPNDGVTGVDQNVGGMNPPGMGGMNPPGMGGMNPVVTPPPCEGDVTACPLPAFPGADGAGGYVRGGRGGDVYHVTLVDTDFSDSRPGTLRFGLSNLTGPRTIVFDVSGVFSMSRSAVAGWSDNGNGWDTASRLNIPDEVTIAGQTAPGPVILRGGVVKAGGQNFILRNVTIAPGFGSRGFDEPEQPAVAGDFPDQYVFDAIDITGSDLIIDHVTTVYATDETISMNEEVSNVTIQYSNISQGQNYPQADAEASGVRYTGHALGSLLQAGSNARVSIHHNLYAQQKGRLPRVGTEADALTVPGVGAFNDLRNNVFYNWFDAAGTGASGQPSQTNFIANFYLVGPGGDDPSGGTSIELTTKAGGTRVFDGNDAVNTKVHHAGNLRDTNLDGDAADGVALTDADFPESSLAATAFVEVPYAGVTEAADVALTRVLDYVGSRYWERGAVDARLIAEVRSGTGKILAWADDPFDAGATEGAEWRALVGTTSVARAADFDTDQDGMPNAWELEHALDPAVADNNGDFDADGYTNLEEYINEIAAWPAATAAQFVGSENGRYAQIQNWRLAAPKRGAVGSTAPWQPGPRDVAQILSGRAVVDAVGQHAGELEVSSSSGLAVLDVQRGWLEVQGALSIGSQQGESSERRPGSGQVVHQGGRVRARDVLLGGSRDAAGEYALLGGVLSSVRLLASGRTHFAFVDGTLHADVIGFDLEQQGGVLWPGRLTRSERLASAEPRFGYLRVLGDLVLQHGTLRVALRGSGADAVSVSGDAVLGGALDVLELGHERPAAGERWTILTAGGSIRGAFERLPEGYSVQIEGQRVMLTYADAPSAFGERGASPLARADGR